MLTQTGEQRTDKIFGIEELKELCEKWQKRLGLSHWQIEVKIQRSEEMPFKVWQGTSQECLETEQALITLLDPMDYPTHSPFRLDMEVSLVHGLLHIPMQYFAIPNPNTLEHILSEAFIERIARLLVSLARECSESRGE